MKHSLAMRMRRPNMLLFNNWMAECLVTLENSSNILDKRLGLWVTLQRIAEETTTQFGLDDPSISIRLTAARVQVIVAGFERRMEEWKKSANPEIVDGIHPSYYSSWKPNS